MASFAPIRGTKTDIQNTPMVDGQFLIETDQNDQNKIYVDTYVDGTLKRSMAGGGGHQILPDPKDVSNPPNEDLVVAAVNNNTNVTEIINSLYGTQRWSNESTKRYIIEGSGGKIGSSGIGTFPTEDETVIQVTPLGTENPSQEGWYEIDTTTGSITIHQYILTNDTVVDPNKKYFSQVIDESDWLYLDILTTIETTNSISGMGADNIDVSLKFDPVTNEAITLGGYIIDTDTGNICIKFGNSITDTEHARVSIDITYTRNDISYIS